LENFVTKKEDNRDDEISPGLFQKQVSDTSPKTNYRGFEVVAILVSQVPVQLIELLFFLGKLVFKHFQFYHKILAFIQFKSPHFKVIADAKTTSYKVLVIFSIIYSFLI
jgi:hypothetical protein